MFSMDGGGGYAGFGNYPQQQIIDEIDKLANHAPQLLDVASATRQGAEHFSTTATTVTAQLSKLVAAWDGTGAMAAAGKFKAIGDWAQQSAGAAESNAAASQDMYTAIMQAKATVPRTVVDTSWNASLKAAMPTGAVASVLSPVVGVAAYAAAATSDHNARVSQADSFHDQAVAVMEQLADRSNQVNGQTQPYPQVPFDVTPPVDQDLPADPTERQYAPFLGNIRYDAPSGGSIVGGPRGSTYTGPRGGTMSSPVLVGPPVVIGSGPIGPVGPGKSGISPVGNNPGAPVGGAPGGRGKNPGPPKGGAPGETDPSQPGFGSGPGSPSGPGGVPAGPGRSPGWTSPSGVDPSGSGSAGSAGGSGAAGFAEFPGEGGAGGVAGVAGVAATGGFAIGGFSAEEGLTGRGVGRMPGGGFGGDEEFPGGGRGSARAVGSDEEFPGRAGTRGSGVGVGAEEEYQGRTGRGAGGFDGSGSGGRGFGAATEEGGGGYRGSSGAGGLRGTGPAPDEEHGPSPYGKAGSAVGSEEESSGSRFGSAGRAGEGGSGPGGRGVGWEEEYAAERYGTSPGANPGMMPPGGRSRGQDEEEYSSAAYLEESDDVWGEGRHVAPPVLG